MTYGHTPEATCSKSGGSFWNPYDMEYDFGVRGTAYYRSVPGTDFYEWYMFEYEFLGDIQEHGNMAITMQEGITSKFRYDSPDNGEYGKVYYMQPTSPVYTKQTTSVAVDFTATFDRFQGSDPSCTAHTARI